MYIQVRKMFFKKFLYNFIKYIFFLQILYISSLLGNDIDYRSNPEIGFKIKKENITKLARNYMVVCADERAASAAENILIRGGNAVDAAIAAQNVLSVVEPQSSGLGGGGFLIYYNKKLNKLEAWDGREISPSSSYPNQYLDSENNKEEFLDALIKPISVGVPGLYSMLADIHKIHGHIDWKDLFVEGIYHAKGFKVSKRLNKMLSWAPHVKNDFYANAIYYAKGKSKKIGSIIENHELENSLKILAKNPYAINKGLISIEIEKKMSPFLVKEDLQSWKTIRRKAICKNLRGYKICGFPPPTSGGVGVIQILSILENFDTNFEPSVTSLDEHLFLEASRLAYADRDVYIADPKFFKIPLEGLLSKKYLKTRADLINIKRATKDVSHGYPGNKKVSNLVTGNNLNFPSTTHISIVDSYGNAVALTSSIEFAFGSGKTVGGFFLNNQLTDFSFRKNNQQGMKIANSVEPKKKPRSSMAPTVIFKNNELIGVLGSPGGSRIICYLAKTIYYMIYFNTRLTETIKFPHLCSRNNFSEIESIFSGDKISEELQLMNHDIVRKEMTSGLNIIWKYKGFWEGYADHRREGVAIGF